MAEQAEKNSSAELNADVKMWAMLTHLVALAGFIIPFGNVIGPMVIWILKKEEHAFIDENGKEALNFQISMTIYFIAAIILIFVAIGIVILPALALFDLIMIIIASVKANSGEAYKYPLTIRFFN